MINFQAPRKCTAINATCAHDLFVGEWGRSLLTGRRSETPHAITRRQGAMHARGRALTENFPYCRNLTVTSLEQLVVPASQT
jgi:hypothetical protein